MIFSTVSKEGLPAPRSMFLIVAIDTPDISARSFWEMPRVLRREEMFVARSMV